MSLTPTPHVSIQEFAELHSVSVSTVRRMIARGELRAYRIGKRLIRLDPADFGQAMREVNPATYAHVQGGDAR
ncbi:excisionase family DNA-binding protein [Micrococcus luteus]|uniref:helix-turn-helix transcriptional regulator n=1 Tax=Micrococcus luteus TaxID=1270 RepID=UPI003017E946